MSSILRNEGSALAELELAEKLASEKGPDAYKAFKEKAVENAKTTEADEGIDAGGPDSAGSSGSSSDSSNEGEEETSDGGDEVDDEFDDEPPEIEEDSSDEEESEEPSEEEEEPDEETEVRQEQLRTLNFIPPEDMSLRMEEFSMGAAGPSVWTGLNFVTSALSTVGLRFAPWLLGNMFKVVLFGFAKTFKTLDSLFEFCSENINRFLNRTSKQKESITALKNKLIELSEKQDKVAFNQKDLSAQHLVIGNSSDVVKNVREFSSFFDNRLMRLNQGMLGALTDIKTVSENRYMRRTFNAMDVMPINPSSMGFVNEVNHGSNPDTSHRYYGMGVMIGNVELRAKLDPNTYDTWGGYEKAYSNSEIFISPLNKGNISTAKALPPAQLMEFLNHLELLADVSLKHQKFYEQISKSRSGIINTVKQLFVRLAEEKVKVSFKDSVALPLHLKSAFASKVYMTGALDLHDHTAQVIANGLTFAAENLKLYTTKT